MIMSERRKMEEVLDYEGLIYSIIRKYPKRYDQEDLFQVGMIGLMDAYKHYNHSFNTKFSSYAYYYIVGEVNKYIRESSTLKVSKSFIDLKKRIIKAKEVMNQRLGREATNLEISLFLEVDLSMIETALMATDEVESIDDNINKAKYYDDTSPTLLDLRSEIDKLSKEERELLKARYYDEFTQMETSKKMGISQVQVSRNETKILQKLKSRL